MIEKPLRIGFMGTPDFARTALETLCGSGHDIVCVYTQPPRPKGRGQKVQKSAVHLFAEERNIPIFTPKSLKSPEVQAEFKAHDLDLAVVAAYGLLLPKAILDAPRHGCVNIHASLLPRWRGASPIQQAIWRGDTETGITLMQMDEGLDTGPMIATGRVSITGDTTCTTLYEDLCRVQHDVMIDFLDDLHKTGAIVSTPQNDTKATHAPLLTKDDGRVDWSQSAIEIDRQVRALTPWPGVWTMYNDRRFKILGVAVVAQSTGDTEGAVLDRTGVVVCGGGTALQIKTIQPHGKKAMDFGSAVNGGYIAVGDRFV